MAAASVASRPSAHATGATRGWHCGIGTEKAPTAAAGEIQGLIGELSAIASNLRLRRLGPGVSGERMLPGPERERLGGEHSSSFSR
jgi:hypothetical protein